MKLWPLAYLSNYFPVYTIVRVDLLTSEGFLLLLSNCILFSIVECDMNRLNFTKTSNHVQDTLYEKVTMTSIGW